MLHCLCYYACSILLFVPLFRASHAFRDQYSKLKHVYAKQSHQYDIFLVAVQLLTFKNSLQILRQNKVGGVIYTIFRPRWLYIQQENVPNSILSF